MDDRDELLCRLHPGIVTWSVRVHHMLANMILYHLANEALKRSTARGGLLQDPRALAIGLNRSLNRLDLTAETLETI